jgi:PKHD-type hydroxylase
MTNTYVFPKETTDPTNYYYYQQGFSPEELERVYANVATLPFEQATVASDEMKDVRSSIIKWVPKNPEWEWLYEKMINMATEANNALWKFDLHSVMDSIQYTEYHAVDNGHYGWHQDIGPGWLSQRKVSITVQLSGPDEYEGGDLQYWQGGDGYLTAPKEKGVVFIFPSYMMHRVTRVTTGIRRSFVLWVGGDHYK